MQILSCSGTLGTCCSDYGLVLIIDTARKVMEIIQMVVPIILIVWGTLELMKLVMNPDEKKGVKKLFNKFIAAAIVFFIPVFVNATMNLLSTDFTVGACWEQAKSKAEIARQSSPKYINPYENEQKTTSILPKPDDYESGSKKSSSNTNVEPWAGGTVTGEQVVAYAKQFIGQGYRLGCHWDGEIPYSPASCIGFVYGVYKHFGFKLDCTENTDKYLKNPQKYTVVTNAPHRPGDIVIYESHYAMLTGNGNEIIHSTSGSNGPKYSKNYKKSSQKLLGIVRVNGVK